MEPELVECGTARSLTGISHAVGPDRKRISVSRKLHVGNLPLVTTNDDLMELFSPFGAVTTAGIVMDKNTGRSRGFGFVEMDEGADSAIRGTHGRAFQGRTIMVSDAQPKVVRPMIPTGSRRA